MGPGRPNLGCGPQIWLSFLHGFWQQFARNCVLWFVPCFVNQRFFFRNVKEFVDWLTRRNSLAAITRCGASIRRCEVLACKRPWRRKSTPWKWTAPRRLTTSLAAGATGARFLGLCSTSASVAFLVGPMLDEERFTCCTIASHSTSGPRVRIHTVAWAPSSPDVHLYSPTF